MQHVNKVFLFFCQSDVQVHFIGEGCKSPVESFWNGSSMIFIMEKMVSVGLFKSRLLNFSGNMFKYTLIFKPMCAFL